MGIFSAECSHCGSKEHASSDCPHGIFSSKCSHCGSVDHSSSDCPHGIFSSRCSHCGSIDHSSSNCPHGIFSSKCSHCGSTEHSSSDCPHGIFSSECSHCGSKNHATSDCPQGLFAQRRPVQETNYQTSTSASGDGWWIGPLIGLIAVIGVVVVVIWLAVFIVLPVALLNSALGLTILAFFYKDRRTLFAGLSFAGGAYLLADVFSGWLSALFVNNVVGNPVWITSFVYLNAAALGVSAWFLVQPLWTNALEVKESDRNKSLILMGGSVALVVAALVSIPLFYHLIPNQLGLRPSNSLSSGGPQNRSGVSTTRPTPLPNVQSRLNLDTSLSTKFSRIYQGTIGNQSFSISLVRDGDRLTGQASTAQSSDTLSGTINSEGQFELKGLENGERFTGIYKGIINGNGSIEGSWTKPGGSRETGFSVLQTQ